MNPPRHTPILATLTLLLLLPFAKDTSAQQDFDNVVIEAVPVTDGVFMLTGSGGNIGLSVGEDGAFLIDDQYAPLTDKINAAIAELTEEPVRFVVNTHWHGDHTGGNENMGKAGAIIVAHENVRERMSTEQFLEAFQRTVPASPAAALPVITFADAVTLHWNGDAIRVLHVEEAHTDGDAIVHFADANVIHGGDAYFNGFYPFIDVSSGGSLAGMVAAADRMLEVADDQTRIIPGHGPLSNRAELQAYRDMIDTVHERVSAMLAEGKSAEEIVAARPTADFDAQWGGGFLNGEQWLAIVLSSMQER